MVVTNMVIYFVIVILLPMCMSVGVEYYDDIKLPNENTEDITQISYTRVTDNEDQLKIANISKQNVSDNNISNTSNPVKYNIRRDHFLYNTVFVGNLETPLLNSTIKHQSKLQKLKPLPSRTLKEYDYLYDDETKQNNLRYSLPKYQLESSVNSTAPSIKSPMGEFYNLEPAVQTMNFNVQYDYTKYYSAWYVIENLPCWELPLLYGEFGKQKRTSDVFLMHGGILKNVIETNSDGKWDNSDENESTSVPLTYYTNKWCKSSPCYGDHTLCLFNEKYMSGMCTKGYKVEVPDVLEQTALINTLNSMRNKIANGESDRYSHLPTAANMKQMIYDHDLENFARVWLNQCLPGPEPCSALDGNFVNQLECTKYAKYCCVKSFSGQYKKCTPKLECFTKPIIGCLHVWFWNAGNNLTLTDVQCGHTSVLSYSTAQLFWATTYKIGCAYGKRTNGDIRVICNFSPGAPYFLESRYYCGILDLKGGTKIPDEEDIRNTTFLKPFGINIDNIIESNDTKRNDFVGPQTRDFVEDDNIFWGIEILHKIYTEGRIRTTVKDFNNGSRDMIARLVLKYKFIELNGAKCDSEEPVYIIGPPGSLCVERGRRYNSLCYDFRDPTPGYRAVAVVAPIALFSLILYDLFSGIVRQTNY